jgi:hypothetical protein
MGPIETVRTATARGAQAIAIGVELLNGQHRNRALLMMALLKGEEAGWREWPSYTDVPRSGWYAYQAGRTPMDVLVSNVDGNHGQ